MEEIKFRYVLQGESDKKIHYKWYYLKQIELELNNLFDLDHYKIISRDQYINKKDINGEELYEGDICEWFDSVREELRINKIEWCDYGFFIADYPCFFLAEDIKVIGNIHENSELLEVSE